MFRKFVNGLTATSALSGCAAKNLCCELLPLDMQGQPPLSDEHRSSLPIWERQFDTEAKQLLFNRSESNRRTWTERCPRIAPCIAIMASKAATGDRPVNEPCLLSTQLCLVH